MRYKPAFNNGLAALTATALLAGCQSAPTTLTQGVESQVQEAGVRDAHLDRVAGHPGLRVDDALRSELDQAIQAVDLADARRLGLAFIDQAEAAAQHAAGVEVGRLPGDRKRELAHDFLNADGAVQQAVGPAYAAAIQADAQSIREQIRQATSQDELRTLLTSLRDAFNTPIRRQGKLGRMLPWLLATPFSDYARDRIYASEYRGNADVPFASATVYRIDDGQNSANATGDDDAALLTRFAPVVVQEAPPADAPYAESIDQIGHVVAPDQQSVAVSTDFAAVYAYARRIYLQDAPHVQLTYTFWYPEHPALKDGDPEAGHVEGVTFRVTLDQNDRPAFFETVYNCGCYHRLYPATDIESAARQAYGGVMQGKSLAIERSVAHRKDLIVPNAVDVPQDATARPVLRVRAGWHGIVDVGFEENTHPDEPHDAANYRLTPYEQLEQLRTPNGQLTSMFYSNGLVKGAQRKEGIYFTPAGMLSAGQPRQRGTQLILWDDWDFDDAQLFEQALRLPREF